MLKFIKTVNKNGYVYEGGLVSLRSGPRCDKISLVLGGVAQGLEQAAHNRLVAGSNPAAPTNNGSDGAFLFENQRNVPRGKRWFEPSRPHHKTRMAEGHFLL